MATSNHERVGKALDLLNAGLRPYFEREMRAAYGEKWLDEAVKAFRDGRLPRDAKGAVNWDTHALLSVVARNWVPVFSKKLGKGERNLVEELRNTRNDWAHQKPFSTDDTYRALDSVHRLLSAISAEQAAEVDRSKQELLRIRFDEQARNDTRKPAVARKDAVTPTALKNPMDRPSYRGEKGGLCPNCKKHPTVARRSRRTGELYFGCTSDPSLGCKFKGCRSH